MLDVAGGLFGLFVLIVTAIYAGELVWRERDTRMADITDSLPAPTWLPFCAKLAALAALQAVLLAVVMLCGIGVQLAKGYTGIELPHYLFELFVLQLAGFLLIARARAVRPHARQQQVRRPLRRCCSLFLAVTAAARLRLRGPALPLREPAGRRLFGHERLRPLPAGGVLVPAVLGRLRGPAAAGDLRAVGARPRTRRRAHGSPPRRRGGRRCRGRSPARRRRCSSPPAASSTTTRTC